MDRIDIQLEKWLDHHQIDVRISDFDRWRAVAYDAEGRVVEFASGESRKHAIEALCVEIEIASFWELPPCPGCGDAERS